MRKSNIDLDVNNLYEKLVELEKIPSINIYNKKIAQGEAKKMLIYLKDLIKIAIKNNKESKQKLADISFEEFLRPIPEEDDYMCKTFYRFCNDNLKEIKLEKICLKLLSKKTQREKSQDFKDISTIYYMVNSILTAQNIRDERLDNLSALLESYFCGLNVSGLNIEGNNLDNLVNFNKVLGYVDEHEEYIKSLFKSKKA